jgi:hypothetical protein
VQTCRQIPTFSPEDGGNMFVSIVHVGGNKIKERKERTGERDYDSTIRGRKMGETW